MHSNLSQLLLALIGIGVCVGCGPRQQDYIQANNTMVQWQTRAVETQTVYKETIGAIVPDSAKSSAALARYQAVADSMKTYAEAYQPFEVMAAMHSAYQSLAAFHHEVAYQHFPVLQAFVFQPVRTEEEDLRYERMEDSLAQEEIRLTHAFRVAQDSLSAAQSLVLPPYAEQE